MANEIRGMSTLDEVTERHANGTVCVYKKVDMTEVVKANPEEVFKMYAHPLRRASDLRWLELLKESIKKGLDVNTFDHDMVVIKKEHGTHGCAECAPFVAKATTEEEQTVIKRACRENNGQYAVVSGWFRVACLKWVMSQTSSVPVDR
jgi:hypothetical protein